MLLVAAKKPLAGFYPKGSCISMLGKLITHITIAAGRERHADVYILPAQRRRSSGTGAERERRAARDTATQRPIDRPRVIGDQSLPFCEVLSVTGIELKQRP